MCDATLGEKSGAQLGLGMLRVLCALTRPSRLNVSSAITGWVFACTCCRCCSLAFRVKCLPVGYLPARASESTDTNT